MSSNYTFDAAKVNSALDILNSVPGELKKSAVTYREEMDKMLATWDSIYKTEFVAANDMNLDQQINQLAAAVDMYAKEVQEVANGIIDAEKKAAETIKG